MHIYYYHIAKAPLYFVRSGYLHIATGRLHYSGMNGRWWSATALSYSSDDARTSGIDIDASTVRPSYDNFRYVGLSLRCRAD